MESEARSEPITENTTLDLQNRRPWPGGYPEYPDPPSDLARIADALEHLCEILDEFAPVMRSRLEGPKWLRGKVSANGNRD